MKSKWSYFTSREKYWDQLVAVNKDSDSERSDLEKIYQDESDGVYSSPFRPLTMHAYPEYPVYNTDTSSARQTRVSQLDSESQTIYSPALMVHETCRQNWPHAEENGVHNSEPCYWEFNSSGDQVYPPEFTEYVHGEINRNNYKSYIQDDNYKKLFQYTPGDSKVNRWVYRNIPGVNPDENREPVMYNGSYIQHGGTMFEVQASEEEQTEDPLTMSPVTSDEEQQLSVNRTVDVHESRIQVEKIDRCGMLKEESEIVSVQVDCTSAEDVPFVSNYTQQFVVYKVTLEGLPLNSEEIEAVKDDPERSLEDQWIPINTSNRQESLIVQGGIEMDGATYEEGTSKYDIFIQRNQTVRDVVDRKSRYNTDSNGEALILVKDSRWDELEYSMKYQPTHWSVVEDSVNALYSYQPVSVSGTVQNDSRRTRLEEIWLQLGSLSIVFLLIMFANEKILYGTGFYIRWAKGLQQEVPTWIIYMLALTTLILIFRFDELLDEMLLFYLATYGNWILYKRNLKR
jgi:hypothetical protein